MRLLYVFPEPFPLPRARSLQVTHSLEALAAEGLNIQFVSRLGERPAPSQHEVFPQLEPRSEFAWKEVSARWQGLRMAPLSSRFFHANLGKWLHGQTKGQIKNFDATIVRHLKSVAPLKAMLPHTPLIYEAHEVFALTAPPHRQVAVRELERQALALADGLITNSQATADALLKEYGYQKPLLVLPNGVHTPAGMSNKFQTLAAEGSAESAPEIALELVYAGSFFGWKGVADLWQALQKLPAITARPLRATLVGGEAENLQAMAKQLIAPETIAQGGVRGKLPNGIQVELLQRQPSVFIQSLLQRAHIAVLPNRPDIESRFTSPIKLFEYMAAGCAIVASDLPAIHEIANTDCARFFNAGQPDDLMQQLQALCHDLPLCARLAEAAYAASQQYTWQARAQRQIQFIQSLTHTKNTNA